MTYCARHNINKTAKLQTCNYNLQYSNLPGPCTTLGDSLTMVNTEESTVYALKMIIVTNFVVTNAKLYTKAAICGFETNTRYAHFHLSDF